MAIFRGTRLEHEKIEHFHCGKPKITKNGQNILVNFWGLKIGQITYRSHIFRRFAVKGRTQRPFLPFWYFLDLTQITYRKHIGVWLAQVPPLIDGHLSIDVHFHWFSGLFLAEKEAMGEALFGGFSRKIREKPLSQRCVEFSFKAPKTVHSATKIIFDPIFGPFCQKARALWHWLSVIFGYFWLQKWYAFSPIFHFWPFLKKIPPRVTGFKKQWPSRVSQRLW